MEMTRANMGVLGRISACLLFLLIGGNIRAQVKTYTIKDGRMLISLDRKLSDASLDSFIVQFNLEDLGLKNFIRLNKADSLIRQGWKIMMQNETTCVISKPLESLGDIKDPGDKIFFAQRPQDVSVLFPAVSNRVLVGSNRFRNKDAFRQNDSIICFYLRGYDDAERVYLSGSFNRWTPNGQAMKQTDSGWISYVKLGPGKYWYKFVVDGRWITDNDNLLRENDGRGNINSVYFRPNVTFSLKGFTAARNVFLSGSFNGWKPKELRMNRTATGWELPLYLASGTHMYKFVVDGRWYADENNPDKAPDGVGAYNSVLAIGKPHLFRLNGFETAKKVMLVGSFNNWRDFELPMRKVQDGWELSYVIGPGNYEYKFLVDGKWFSDPGNPLTPNKEGNSFLIIEPNYSFNLKGFKQAKQVFVAGDFNGWNPAAFPMTRTAEGWTFSVHLPVGKTRYKFIVDGTWILDPANKLWEQNEHNTGNSVIWVEKY